MNPLASISFGFLFLIQAMGSSMDLCCELQKLPNLFDHYQEHKDYDGDSLWDFLVEDYFSDESKIQEHHDDSDHSDLPFHGQHQCCHGAIFIPPFLSRLDAPLFYLVLQKEGSLYNFSITSEYLETLFQPPRA